MKIIRLVKQLNNTEAGNGNTHESYILVTSGLDVSDIFEKDNELIEFYDYLSGESFGIRKTSGRETRIVGFGEYYSKYNLAAGDEIILQKVIKTDSVDYIICNKKNDNTVVAQKLKTDFEILRGKQKALDWEDKDNSFTIEFVEKRKKRADSPVLTDVYKLIVNGNDVGYKYKKDNMVLLNVDGNKVTDTRSYAWKKYTFEMEE